MTPERSFEVKTNPPASQVYGLRDRPIPQHRTWESNRHYIVFPVPDDFLHSRDHLLGSHFRPGDKFSRHTLARNQNFDVGAAYIND
jgi:hypothetical protein